MKLIFEGLLIICACMWTIALFQIEVAPQSVLAAEQPMTNMNKTNYGYQLESNVTHDNTTSEITYKEPQHGISMSFPSNWTFSTSGLSEYNQIAAFYAPLQNLSDPIPAILTIAVMSYEKEVPLMDFTNMTVSSLNQTGQITITSSDPITIAGQPGHQLVFSTLPNMGNPISFKILHSWTIIDNKVYVFQYSAETVKFNTHLPTIKHILESLSIE
ncbi:MAG: PsbP-related protein [Candidatus Thorarchaeota archaeon]